MWLTQDLSPALTAAPASPSNPNPSQSTAQANPMNWVPTANSGMGGLVADPNATFTVVEATGVYGFPKGAKVLCRPLVRYNPSFNAAVCYWEVVEAPPLFVDFELYYDITPKGVDIIAWPLVVDSQTTPTKLTRDASTNPPTLKVSDLVLKNCRAYGSQHGGFSNGAQGVARWEKTLNKWCVISLQNLSKRCSATAYSSVLRLDGDGQQRQTARRRPVAGRRFDHATERRQPAELLHRRQQLRRNRAGRQRRLATLRRLRLLVDVAADRRHGDEPERGFPLGRQRQSVLVERRRHRCDHVAHA